MIQRKLELTRRNAAKLTVAKRRSEDRYYAADVLTIQVGKERRVLTKSDVEALVDFLGYLQPTATPIIPITTTRIAGHEVGAFMAGR